MTKLTKAQAGRHEGNFTVRRPMTGAKAWARGDTRTDRLSDVAHLAESGALVAADKETAGALTAYLGRDVAVGEIVPPATDIASLVDPATPATDAGDLDGERDGRRDAPPPPPPPPPPSDQGGPSLKGKTVKQLVVIAKKEGVTVETDDNKADLVRKIETHRKAARPNANKAESTRGVQTKTEA